jgi:hypothetical protein
MEKERACKLLTEALAGRAVTGAGLEVVKIDGRGDSVRHYLKFDGVVKVELAWLSPRPEKGKQAAAARRLEKDLRGKTIECVELTSLVDGRKFAELSLSKEEVLFPMWNVEFLNGEVECELNKALINAGLQAPQLLVSNEVRKNLTNRGLRAPWLFVSNDGDNEN